MKRIALLTDGIYPYVIGGMQKHSYYLTKYFAENNIHVDLYHCNKSELDIDKLELFSEKQKANISSIVIPFPSKGKLPGHYIKESYLYSSSIWEELKKREPVDFIYVKGFSGWRSIEQKKQGAKLPPIGINFHGYEMFQEQFDLRSQLNAYLFKGPVKFNSLNADHVFSYGGKITELIRKIGVAQEKIIEVPTGIDPSWITPSVKKSGNKRKFIFIGRYERRKGIEELNKVLKKVMDKNEFQFEFIGPVPENKKIISDRIIYHGAITDQEKMKQLISGCDVLVCPSLAEGMPNVIMEAMACGLAVIATDVGAVSKMVDRTNGWIIDPGNEPQLEKVVLDAIRSDSNEIDKMKLESLTRVEDKYRWDKLIFELIIKLKI